MCKIHAIFSKDGHTYPIPYAFLTMWYHIGILPSRVGFRFLSLNLRGPLLLLGPIKYGKNNAGWLQSLGHNRRYSVPLALSLLRHLFLEPSHVSRKNRSHGEVMCVCVFWLTAPARPPANRRHQPSDVWVNNSSYNSSSQPSNLLALDIENLR